jgi:hypothetical protein
MTQRLNACHNRASFRETLRIQDGWQESGPSRVPVMKTIPFRMSPDCQYTRDPMGLGSKDPGCTGCRWKDTPVDAPVDTGNFVITLATGPRKPEPLQPGDLGVLRDWKLTP